MKKLVFAILVSYITFSCVSNSPKDHMAEFEKRNNFYTLPANTETEKYIEFENGFITVQLDRAVFYKFVDSPYNPAILIDIYYNKYGDPYYQRTKAITKYFNINDKPIEWSIVSLTPEIAIPNEYSRKDFKFIKDGVATFKVTVGAIETTISTTITNLPFGKNVTYDNLIEILGFPNKESYGSAIWPNDAKVDNLTYSTILGSNLDKQSLSIRHLYYNKYPGLIIALISDNLKLYDKVSLKQFSMNNDIRPKV